MTDGANMNTMSDGIMKKNEMAIPTDYQAIYEVDCYSDSALFYCFISCQSLTFLGFNKISKVGFHLK